jgi:hypothetical protein
MTSESSANVFALWGSGPADVYASTAPGTTILHSAGDGSWQTLYAQDGGAAWAGWSSGPGDAFAVVSPAGDGADAFVLHATPSGWTPETVGQPGARLVTIWGSGPQDIYAGGYHKGPDGLLVGDLYHSAGDGQWMPVGLPGHVYQVKAVWGASPGSVYVGVYDIDDGPTVLHGQLAAPSP